MDDELAGIDEIEKHTELSAVTLFDLRNNLGLPIEKKGGIWYATRTGLSRWLKENGLEVWGRQFSLAKVRAVQLRARRQGPGKVFSGDMDFICEKLDIAPGTFLDVLNWVSCPIIKLENKKYSVDTNRWADFREDRDRASH
jgi:hypothetical protein